MENIYTQRYSRYRLTRSSSLPLFNTPQNKYRPTISPNTLKMQMMEERLKHLEKQKQKQEQNGQISALMSYQMNQNRLRNTNNNSNGLLLSSSSMLPPIAYHLDNPQPIENEYYIMKTNKDSNKKERKKIKRI